MGPDPDPEAPESLSAEVGRRLRERRNDLGRTLADVAEAAMFSPAHLGEIETGKSLCSLPVLLRVCQALDYPVAEILPRLGGHRVRVGEVGGGPDGDGRLSHDELDLLVLNIELAAGEEHVTALDRAEAHVFVLSGTCRVRISGSEATMGAQDSADIAMAETVTLLADTATSVLIVVGADRPTRTAR